MKLSRRHLAAFAGVAMLAVAAGCSGTRETVRSNTVEFTAQMSGAAEVPANTSAGKGTLTATLRRDTNVLRWSVNYSGLTGAPTMAHFHGPAMPGENAPPVVTFTNLAPSADGQAQLTVAQAEQLIAGKWYVNYHTAQYPGGEIRGQLIAK